MISPQVIARGLVLETLARYWTCVYGAPWPLAEAAVLREVYAKRDAITDDDVQVAVFCAWLDFVLA